MTDNILRQCSYRGIDFYFSEIKLSCGRRLSVNDLPFQSKPFIQDMGKVTDLINLSGFVIGIGDNPLLDANNRANLLQNAFNAKGDGVLELAYFPDRMVVKTGDCELDYSEATNKINFNVTVYPNTLKTPTVNIVNYQIKAETYSENLLNKYIFLLNKYVTDFTNSVQFIVTAKYAVENSKFILNGFKGFLFTIFDALNFENESDRERIKANMDNLNDTDYVPYYGILHDIAITPKKDNNLNAFNEVLEFVPTTITPVGSKTKKQDAINQTYLTHTFKQMMIASYAVMLTQSSFNNKEQAIYHRARLSDLLDSEFELIIDDSLNELMELVNNSATYLTEVIATLAPVLTIDGHTQELPVSYWCHRLYGTLDNLNDVIERNSIADPYFTPLSFKTLGV